MNRPKTHNHSLNRDFAQEWLVVFVVNKTIGEIMNYSLTGKARVAAKNTMQSKRAVAANVKHYAQREGGRTQRILSFAGADVSGKILFKWVKGTVNRSNSLNVI